MAKAEAVPFYNFRFPKNLSEPQVFKNVSLQMMIDETFTFYCIFHKKLHHIQVFDVRYEWPKRKRYPFTTSASPKICRFQLPLPHFCLKYQITLIFQRHLKIKE